jgi:hypothetical protein
MLRDVLGVPGLQQWYACGGGSTGVIQSLISQGENPRSGLNWLCLAMFLLEALFSEWELSSWRKPQTFGRMTTAKFKRRNWNVALVGLRSMIFLELLAVDSKGRSIFGSRHN